MIRSRLKVHHGFYKSYASVSVSKRLLVEAGLNAEDSVDVVAENGQIVLRKVLPDTPPFVDYRLTAGGMKESET